MQYDKHEAWLRSVLSQQKDICLTADIWSCKNRSFLGVSAHFMDDSLIRKSYVIACKYFPAPHNHQTIAEEFQLLYSKFGINPSSITATVTDNGSNFVKAFSVYGHDKNEFTKFLEAGDDELDLIPYEEEDRSKVFDVLNTLYGQDQRANDDDDFEYEALLDLLHSNSSENDEECGQEANHVNESEEILKFFKSRVTNSHLDSEAAFAAFKNDGKSFL